MMVMLITYFALFSIKKFAIGTAMTIPLIIMLILYRGAVASTFRRPMEVLSLHAAADLDRADKVSILPHCADLVVCCMSCQQLKCLHRYHVIYLFGMLRLMSDGLQLLSHILPLRIIASVL
jgi:hypothetical protein